MALATMSSALSGEVGPIRRRAWRAATAPATMLAIQPMTTSRMIPLNIASSSHPRSTTASDLSAYSVRPSESAPREAEQVLGFETEQVAGSRQVERDCAAIHRPPKGGRRVVSGEQLGGRRGRDRVRCHDVDDVAGGHLAFDRQRECPRAIADVEIGPELVGEDGPVPCDGLGAAGVDLERVGVRDAEGDDLVAVSTMH